MSTEIDQLREEYLARGTYPYDPTTTTHFTDEELVTIEKYGYWFNAIWEDNVPLVTDKLKHFYLAKSRQFHEKTRLEALWFKYKNLELPF